MGWILVVGIERVLRGNICKSDFFLNLFWIPSDFFWLNSIVGNFHGLLVESQRWELREFWEVTFEGLGICLSPLASTSSHLEPASVYFFQTFPQKTFWSSSSSQPGTFFIHCLYFPTLPNFCQPAQIMLFASFNYFSRLFCSNQREIFGNLAQSPILNSKPKQSTL